MHGGTIPQRNPRNAYAGFNLTDRPRVFHVLQQVHPGMAL